MQSDRRLISPMHRSMRLSPIARSAVYPVRRDRFDQKHRTQSFRFSISFITLMHAITITLKPGFTHLPTVRSALFFS